MSRKRSRAIGKSRRRAFSGAASACLLNLFRLFEHVFFPFFGAGFSLQEGHKFRAINGLLFNQQVGKAVELSAVLGKDRHSARQRIVHLALHFRVDTRGEGDDVWVTRYYNAPASGSGTLDVDIWRQGNYAVRAAACDTDGNESPLADVGTVFIDTTSPVIRSLTITDITETGFSLHHRVTDNGTLAGLSVTLTSDTGETRSSFLVTDGESDFPWSAEGLTEGVWTISVTASDAAGNESRYTFDWKYTAGTARPGLTVARLGAP